jgi:hypothetical protein
MMPAEVPRRDLREALLARARSGQPLLLTGPPGSGKTTLLHAVAEALRREGWITVYLDLMGAASSPERFVAAALAALPAEHFGAHLPRALEIRRLADSGRSNGAAAVQSLFSLWSVLHDSGGRPVALLLDEATEIRSLAYFTGLREVDRPFGQALASRPRGTLLATSFPTLARRLWSFETSEARPLTSADLELIRRSLDLEGLVRASFGWPRYVRVLVDRLDGGSDLVSAWVEEMAPGGRLDQLCRHTYETLLLRSRGYGMSKAALAAVAEEEGLNLTALVERLGRTPGAIRDYLGWLLGVDALRMVQKRYYYVDGMLRCWVRLHGRGRPPTSGELWTAARAVAGARVEGDSGIRLADDGPDKRKETLMEID